MFEESAPTFAENSAGKAIHYSRHTNEIVLSDDSGLVVRALGGEPGVHSARYAGPNATGEERVAKLPARWTVRMTGQPALSALARWHSEAGRSPWFPISWRGSSRRNRAGRAASGTIRYSSFRHSADSLAEISQADKNVHSHRGKAFQKIFSLLVASDSLPLFHASRI